MNYLKLRRALKRASRGQPEDLIEIAGQHLRLHGGDGERIWFDVNDFGVLHGMSPDLPTAITNALCEWAGQLAAEMIRPVVTLAVAAAGSALVDALRGER